MSQRRYSTAEYLGGQWWIAEPTDATDVLAYNDPQAYSYNPTPRIAESGYSEFPTHYGPSQDHIATTISTSSMPLRLYRPNDSRICVATRSADTEHRAIHSPFQEYEAEIRGHASV